MKSHYLTDREKTAAAAIVQRVVRETNERTQKLWVLAMYNAGLSPRTINRVAVEMSAVCEKYAEYKRDGIQDDAVKRDLKRIGMEA